jgi:protein TonB
MRHFILLTITLVLVTSNVCSAKKIKNHDPIAIVTIAPNYPQQAAVAGIEGEVTLEFTITEKGSVIDPVVIDSTPKDIFDKEAIRAIMKFKFAPAIKNRKPVESRAQQTIRFRLSR